MVFYSASKGGFYSNEVHGDSKPSDCVEVTQQEYDELMSGNCQGKAIVPDENGRPVLSDGPEVSIPYNVRRRMEYPAIGDQLDALFNAGVFPPEMAEKIRAVKAKYPKE